MIIVEINTSEVKGAYTIKDWSVCGKLINTTLELNAHVLTKHDGKPRSVWCLWGID